MLQKQLSLVHRKSYGWLTYLSFYQLRTLWANFDPFLWTFSSQVINHWFFSKSKYKNQHIWSTLVLGCYHSTAIIDWFLSGHNEIRYVINHCTFLSKSFMNNYETPFTCMIPHSSCHVTPNEADNHFGDIVGPLLCSESHSGLSPDDALQIPILKYMHLKTSFSK